MVEEDLDIVFTEILRQYKITQEFIDKLEGKLELILGLIFVFIGYLFTQDIIFAMLNSPNWVVAILTIIALIFIGYSAWLAYKGYGIGTYGTGPEIEQVMESYFNSNKINFKEEIGLSIIESILNNEVLHNGKKEKFKGCYLNFIRGTALLLSSRFLYDIARWI